MSAPIDHTTYPLLRAELGRSFGGHLISPESAGYDDARAVWNAMVDRRPGLIARCANVADVVTAVRTARRLGLVLSVRGGGHSVTGNAHADGGLTVDLGPMRRVEIDPERRLVHADGGCLLGDVDAATADHGLVVPLGTVSETGLGGLALGGGVGWLTRRYGLTCDNLLAAEVVLASGGVIKASPTWHPDLFWALRGGSGNFGVVTRFTLRGHPFGPMMRMAIALYHPADAKRALREFARVVPRLPRTVGWHAALKRHLPPLPFVPAWLVGERVLMLFGMWLGDEADPSSDEYLARLRQVGDPCVTTTTILLPFGEGVQRMLDPEFAAGHRNHTSAVQLTGLPDRAIDTIVDFWTGMPMGGELQILSFGGATRDIPPGGTAFAHRDCPWWLVAAGRWQSSTQDSANTAAIRRLVRDLRPFSDTGVYVNLLADTERVVDAYGGAENYARLGRVKARYDPDNFFRVNANIFPYSMSPAHASN